MRAALHRWGVVAYVVFAMTLAAARHMRRARYRRRLGRRVDAWPW